MYTGKNNVWSDLANSYAWDTAIVCIQMCSEKSNYINTGAISSHSKTGRLGDKVCNIHDMVSNCYEWSTEYSTRVLSSGSRWTLVH
ncbi:MAG: hypothetical protein HFJ30_03920 [Clostridia bacterium]|jgi:hypothetical protein|nr:hypothetical protein [Clostridia bacterium]